MALDAGRTRATFTESSWPGREVNTALPLCHARSAPNSSAVTPFRGGCVRGNRQTRLRASSCVRKNQRFLGACVQGVASSYVERDTKAPFCGALLWTGRIIDMRRFGITLFAMAALAAPTLISMTVLAQAGGAKPGTTTAASASAASAAPATSGSAPAASATAATSAAPTTTAAPTGSAGMDGPTYAGRLRDLEARVDELKDQIRRSHTRLALLSDTILSGGAAGSRAEVSYHNEMSSAFRLVKALFVLDGAVQYNRADDTGALADQKEIPVFTGSVPPGDHTVNVVLNFQGNGYGVFTYLKGYKFEVKSSHSFTVVEGKTLSISATSYEDGGGTTARQDRPKSQGKEKDAALGAGAAAAAPAASASGDSK